MELAALRQLADAGHAVVARWPVGRAIALALTRRGLVWACSEWVGLTQAGRQVLGAYQDHRPDHTLGAQHDTTTEQAAPPSRRDTPPGVLLWAARKAARQ